MPLFPPPVIPPLTGAEPLASGESLYARIASQGGVQLVTTQLMLTYWKAATTGSATGVTTLTGGTAATGLTLAQIGIFSVDASGDLTLVASTADLHTTLWTGTYTEYTAPLQANFARTAGAWYAAGFLAVGVSPPVLDGLLAAGAFLGTAPMLAGTVAAQASMPSTVASGGIGEGYQMVAGIVAP